MKSDKNLIFADIVYFDLIYPSEKKRENSNRGQKMSAKICQKFLYCELTLVTPIEVTSGFILKLMKKLLDGANVF